jgi:hypothetical protein
MPQRDPDVPVHIHPQPRIRDKRPQGVPTETLEAFALTGADNDAGVQVESTDARLTRAEPHRRRLLSWRAEPSDAAAGARPERDQPLD